MLFPYSLVSKWTLSTDVVQVQITRGNKAYEQVQEIFHVFSGPGSKKEYLSTRRCFHIVQKYIDGKATRYEFWKGQTPNVHNWIPRDTFYTLPALSEQAETNQKTANKYTSQ